MAVVTHPSALAHDPGPRHPERAERVSAVVEALRAGGIADRVRWADAPAASRPVLELVHDPRYLDELERLDSAGGGWIDRDTRMGSDSLEAAVRGSGAAVEAASNVLEGIWSGAFCLMRPPGHHAPWVGPGVWPGWARSRPSMGFCVTNHAAVAARWAVTSGGAAKAAVVDWDAHHGNGTQDIFWEDPDVLYASVHQYPFYPGTGDIGETGEGAGAGTTVNVPLPAGSDESAYLRALDEVIGPALTAFGPDLIVISAGYDAHLRDPVCMMRLTAGAFFRFTQRLRSVAPIVCVLEGGYDLDALGWGVCATLSAALGDPDPAGVPEGELGSRQGSVDAHRWVDRAAAARR